jgi:ADP-heptose:LPS heptosyltransferase
MSWSDCKNILVIRPDNLGDLIMTSPAIRALKQTFNCRITVLTSPAGEQAAVLIPEIDDTIIASVPWVRSIRSMTSKDILKLVDNLSKRHFDAAIIFTVYSQNPLPSAMVAWMSNIPRRLAYCRENPYDLINYWIPDEEPYAHIIHQVERDLKLVNHIGASTDYKDIILNIPDDAIKTAEGKLRELTGGSSEFIILHAGVSDIKRAYPIEKWAQLGKQIIERFELQVIFTGIASESL